MSDRGMVVGGLPRARRAAPSILLALLLGAGGWLALPGQAAAQTVAGRLTEQETGGPLSAAVVMLVDSAGRQRTAVLSDSTGAFLLRAPAAGRYRVRAEHIGRETVSSDLLSLGAGASVSVRLEAPIAAVLLRPLSVEVRSRCELHAVTAETTQRLWEEARKAFRVSVLARKSQPFVLRLFDRDLDPKNFRVLRERQGEKAGFGGRPFGAESESLLDSLGYVQKVSDALDELVEQWAFWAPDEEVLVSDGFIQHHCLSMQEGGRRHRGLVGIDFEPVRPLGRDIRGTVWLDARSAELRAVEFQFTNLPWVVPDKAQGGQVEFQRLPSGVVIMRSWYVRMPIVRTESAGQGGVLTQQYLAGVIESGGELEGPPPAKGPPPAQAPPPGQTLPPPPGPPPPGGPQALSWLLRRGPPGGIFGMGPSRALSPTPTWSTPS